MLQGQSSVINFLCMKILPSHCGSTQDIKSESGDILIVTARISTSHIPSIFGFISNLHKISVHYISSLQSIGERYNLH